MNNFSRILTMAKIIFNPLTLLLIGFVVILSGCQPETPDNRSTEPTLASQIILPGTPSRTSKTPKNSEAKVPSSTAPMNNNITPGISPKPSQGQNSYPEPGTSPQPTPNVVTLDAYPPINPPSIPLPSITVQPMLQTTLLPQEITVSSTLQPTITEVISTPTPIIFTQIIASDPAAFKLASGMPQFVEFFAYWCPLCRSMAPVVHVLEFRYSGKIRFVYLDIDNPANDTFKKTLGFSSPPQFFLLDGQGNTINEWIGYVDEVDLDAVFFTIQ